MKIRGIIKEYKCFSKRQILHLIPLYDGDNLRGYLRPITFDFENSLPDLIPMLSKWRRENPTAGTGIFEVTDERTKRWLEKFVLQNENRIIFLIQDIQGNYIGHIGLAAFQYDQKAADIDAVLRGEKNKEPGIMSVALQALIAWGKSILKLSDIFLDVYNDNVSAISFYERNGFKEIGRIALEKVNYQDEVKWEINVDRDPETAEKCYIRMKYMGGYGEIY